jgi:hypothetical protein
MLQVIGATEQNPIDTAIFSVLLPIAVFIAFFLLAIIALFIVRTIVRKRAALKAGVDEMITYLITVPKHRKEEDKGSGQQYIQEKIATMETFYAALGGLKAQRGFNTWLYGRSDAIALEIVAKDGLISFYLSVPVYLDQFLQQQLQAQFPDAHIESVEDYNLFAPHSSIVGSYLTLKRDNSVPIRTYKQQESDPLNGITNALSKVPDDEGVAIQVLARSAKPGWRSKGRTLTKNMQKGMSYNEAIRGGNSSWGSVMKSKDKQDIESQKLSERRLTRTEEEMIQGIDEKVRKAGLDVNIRIIAASKMAASAQANLSQVVQSFGQFNIYEFGNAFSVTTPKSKKRLVRSFIHRLFDEKQGMVLNSEELSSLWHLPLPSTETPKIRWLEARVAPVPNGIPSEGLHLGFNEYRGQRTEVHIGDEDRRRHMYLIGKTGSGKSYFLRYMALQDIRNGHGVAVVDPHGDLVDAIMGLIPKDRIDDVIYFNPSDLERPMGLNMLEAKNPSMRDFAVQEMISIFMMLFPPEIIGPMFEHNMRNYMLTLMSDLDNPGTLVEIPRLVTDSAYQKKWLDKVTDPLVRSYWEDEVANTSDHTKSEMMGYLVSKLGRFVENEMMRNIIGQQHSAIDFREAMDEGKILLINLAKGATGDVNANLLGLIIVSKMQMAAFTRTDIPEDERKDFYLYIDEFQNFITPSIATILSEARKYRLNLVLAHQYMGQLVQDGGKTEIRDAVMGNVGNLLAARVGPEDTEILGKVYDPVFTPYDLMNTDKFTWNAKIIAGNAQLKPFTLKAVAPDEPDTELAKKLKEISRLSYGKAKSDVERELAERAQIGVKRAKNPPPPPLEF